MLQYEGITQSHPISSLPCPRNQLALAERPQEAKAEYKQSSIWLRAGLWHTPNLEGENKRPSPLATIHGNGSEDNACPVASGDVRPAYCHSEKVYIR
jgi:hypothetical protein